METNTPEHTPSPTPSVLDDPEVKAAFLARLEQIFAKTKTHAEAMRESYANDKDSFEKDLNELVESVAKQDPEFQATFAELREIRRLGPGRDTELVKKLNEIRSHLKAIVVSELGLPDEARFTEIEQARNHVRDILGTRSEEITSPDDALTILGIRTVDENERVTNSFPYDLMPASVIEKWKTYLATVCRHIELATSIKSPEQQEDVANADRTRQFAHNTVTTDVHTILNLGAMGWKWEDTRRLLGTMRDTELPDWDAAQTEEAKALIKAHTGPILVADALSRYHS